jgi:hypothetical protein
MLSEPTTERYEQLLDEAFREVRSNLAGQPVDIVLPALVVRLEELAPGRVPPLEVVVLLAEVIAKRLPLTPAGRKWLARNRAEGEAVPAPDASPWVG